jgi:hypothetical protein
MNSELRTVLMAFYPKLWELYKSKELNLWGDNDDEVFVTTLLNLMDDYLDKDIVFREEGGTQ